MRGLHQNSLRARIQVYCMRLLQVSLRTSLVYSLILVLISIPLSILSIRAILNEEVDESLALHSDQFLKHIKSFEYLDDLEMDLEIWDQLSYDITIDRTDRTNAQKEYRTVLMYDSVEQDFRPFRLLSSTVEIKGKPYLLTTRMSLVDNDELLIALGLVQAGVVLLLAAGLLLLNRSLTRKLWKPFYNTLNQLKAYELDKSESIHTDKTSITEFDDFNKTVLHLTDRNRKVFTQQKEFIENASHELQTPLAIFQAKLDILMQNPALMEAEATTILELEQTANRMAKLNKNLLLLSRIDNDQFTQTEDVDLAYLADSMLANLRPMADVAMISIESSTSTLMLKANPTLIEVLLTNLFHNAIRHTPPGGKISIVFLGRTLKLSNTGSPLTMDADKIFERFRKESKNENSSGLGLAIVKKICEMNGYQLKYTFSAGLHTFMIAF